MHARLANLQQFLRRLNDDGHIIFDVTAHLECLAGLKPLAVCLDVQPPDVTAIVSHESDHQPLLRGHAEPEPVKAAEREREIDMHTRLRP